MSLPDRNTFAVGDLNNRTTWPALPLNEWKQTCATLHMWTQVVGKVRMKLSPPVNHWWHVPLYVNSAGLTTSAIPYGQRVFEMQFDFINHKLSIHASDDASTTIALYPRSVADFYREVMAALRSLGIEVKIWSMPVEITNPIPFEQDHEHAAYDAPHVQNFWRILIAADRVLNRFRGGFIGKCSPVHFFWGSFDLAVTRFSGRRAPERPGADSITREAYSHEVISAGFWPGGGDIAGPVFYCYAAPAPDGFATSRVRPEKAFYRAQLSEFLLMYDDVRAAESPEDVIMDFLQDTYQAGAELAKWDRKALERSTAP